MSDPGYIEDMVVIALHILINFFIIASGVPDAGGTPHFRAFLKGLPVNNVFFELTAPNKNILTVTRLSGSATRSGFFYFLGSFSLKFFQFFV